MLAVYCAFSNEMSNVLGILATLMTPAKNAWTLQTMTLVKLPAMKLYNKILYLAKSHFWQYKQIPTQQGVYVTTSHSLRIYLN